MLTRNQDLQLANQKDDWRATKQDNRKTLEHDKKWEQNA